MTLLEAPLVVRTDSLLPAELLSGWDHLELWVGNARAAAHWLVAGFGFTAIAYAGPETGVRDRVSWVLAQGDVRFVVTAGLDPGGRIADHVRRHGDGVHAISFAVDSGVDVATAFEAAVERGARALDEPREIGDGDGVVVTAAVAGYGDVVQRFTFRSHPRFAPGFSDEGLFSFGVGQPVGLTAIDHVVGNVEAGMLDTWVDTYRSTFGFTELTHFDRDQISTEFSALRSTVLTNRTSRPSGTGRAITMPINEPAEGRKRSQIQEYLDAQSSPGVQHIAFATDDIVASVAQLRGRGVRFLTPPASYYRDARVRMGDVGVDLPWADLSRLGILVDRDAAGHLLQVFTETFGDRPTLFFEVIQRHGAEGFGEGNFKALFEAIEHEQARRGNL